MNGLTKAAQDVLAERERQRQKWGDLHDDRHGAELLARESCNFLHTGMASADMWARKSKENDGRRTQLVKGVAVALAALECFDRTAGAGGNDGR
jgi:hypothetical protein